ncbi:MAG: hypothetical protein HXX11_23730, partial [Desulfuromonadales bacterium]|nr:hypothetical protein [Desulfuromonadales bacterium]
MSDDSIMEEGIRSIEQFVLLDRSLVPVLINTLRRYLIFPCPNLLREKPIKNDPDNAQVWSDGRKAIHLLGDLVDTNLPNFNRGVRYTLSIYWIDRNPDDPAKFELTMFTPDGKRISENDLPV